MNNLPSPNLLPFFLSLVRGESTLGLDELSLGVIDCERLPGPLPAGYKAKWFFFQNSVIVTYCCEQQVFKVHFWPNIAD